MSQQPSHIPTLIIGIWSVSTRLNLAKLGFRLLALDGNEERKQGKQKSLASISPLQVQVPRKYKYLAWKSPLQAEVACKQKYH